MVTQALAEPDRPDQPDDRPPAPVRLSTTDRLLAGLLTWLLMLTWSSGVLVVALWAGGVSATSSSVQWWSAVLGVVGVVGTGVPLLRWLRPAVDAVLFSHPEDARVLISQFGRQFHDVPSDPDARADLVGQIANQIAARLRLPYVAIVEPGSDQIPPGASGLAPPASRLLRMPITFAGADVGTLLVAPRHRDARLASQDIALLDDLAVQIGIALHAARVTDDLRESRAAVITAREEERRRIRRDLHDGLGPALASLRLHLAAVEQLIPADPGAASALVERLRAEVRDTSAQLRGLVYGLRPPMLDEFGLLGAIRSRAASLHGVAVAVDVPDPMPDLPAAAEVALFRIASEALENVGRHAGASVVRVAMTLDDGNVRLVVEDDGHGLPAALVAGVGLAGMRERAAELRGSLQVESRRPDPGTRVVAVVPLTRKPSAPTLTEPSLTAPTLTEPSLTAPKLTEPKPIAGEASDDWSQWQ